VRGDTDIVCPDPSVLAGRSPWDNLLCHSSDLLGLTDTSSMSDVGLDNIDTASFKVGSAVKTCEQPLTKLVSQQKPDIYLQQTYSNWNRCLIV
jgi:hypothetical protein